MDTSIIALIIIAVTVVVVVILWQGMSVAKTQMTTDQTYQYRKLAEQVAESEQKSADAQQKTAEAVEDIRARLTAIEKLLRDVQ
jgi:predicted negative regulator of RcsB-dependent stress response